MANDSNYLVQYEAAKSLITLGKYIDNGKSSYIIKLSSSIHYAQVNGPRA